MKPAKSETGSDWFTRNGVAPPENIPHLTEEELAEKIKSIKHGQWIQEGNVLTCRACPNYHSTVIPVDVLLQGTDDNGHPVLKRLPKHLTTPK